MFVGQAKGIFTKGTAHVAAAAPAVVAQIRAQGAPHTRIFTAFGDATGSPVDPARVLP